MSRLSRRQFVHSAGAGLIANQLASHFAWSQSAKPITAKEVVDRIKAHLGIPWEYSTYRDTFKIGGPDSVVHGIASSFGANLRVLQLANKAGLNMVVVHEPTFYSDGDRIDLVKDDPLYKAKQHWADLNNMVVWRIHDHWHARKPDGIRTGWIRAAGWDQYRVDGSLNDFKIPDTTLGELAKETARKFDTRSVRVIGDPALKVSRVKTGGRAIAQIMDNLANFDCLISNDNREYDTYEYMRDIVLSGAKKGAIFTSHSTGEDTGMEEFERWAKPFIPEVPIKFIPTTDEFWTV
jgi:putative NIF3 family GTP cyclohydrolase 1 type 2